MDVLDDDRPAMEAAREMVQDLRTKIGLAEIECAQDCIRYRAEAEQREKDRWRRLEYETVDLRRMLDHIEKTMADVEMLKPIPPFIVAP